MKTAILIRHALWNYVHKEDAAFRFENTQQHISGMTIANGVRWEGSVLNLTSQA